MNIVLQEMTSEEFEKYSAFAFQNYVQETVRSSGRSTEEVLKLAGSPPNKPTLNDIWRVICAFEEPIGFIWIHLFPEKKEAFGYDIFLNENYRSQGIGRCVMGQCRQLLKTKGIKTIEICVFQDNQIARNLYASLGFKEKSYDALKRQFRLEIEV